MRVLLAQTPNLFPTTIKLVPPTTLLYLGAILKEGGHEVTVLDPILEGMSRRHMVDAVCRSGADVFGLYVPSDTYFEAARVFRAVKERNPRITTIAGGPHPTLLPESILEHCPALDVVVRGDAEEVLPLILDRLARKEPLAGIDNTSFRAGGSIFNATSWRPVTDLDRYPLPDYGLTDLERYHFSYFAAGQERKALNIVTARGCPFDCLFCSNTNLTQRQTRYRSLAHVLREIEHAQSELGVSFFWIQDDAFNLSVRRVLDFCDEIERRRLPIYWSCIIRADNAKHDVLARMKETGFVGGYFAIEHINDELRQRVLGKKLTGSQIESALKAFNELDLWCGINFVTSIPGETRAQLEENVRYIESLRLKNKASMVVLNILKIYPGTRLETEARKRGVIRDGFSWFDERKLRRFSPGIFPGLYGMIPFYKDGLGYTDLFAALFRWRATPYFPVDPNKSSGVFTYLRSYLSNTRTLKDLYLLGCVFVGWLKATATLLRSRRREPAGEPS
jgi:anaerobic magnesium-protoporphyrin IX monomethyl ester cyclase